MSVYSHSSPDFSDFDRQTGLNERLIVIKSGHQRLRQLHSVYTGCWQSLQTHFLEDLLSGPSVAQ